MDINIDIDKLSGEWKQWAENADTAGDKDKHINSIMEIDNVINQALAANKDAKEIASVFNTSITGKEQDVSAQKEPDKKDAKDMRKNVLDKVFAETNNFITSGDWDAVANNLTAAMFSQTQSIVDRIYYSKLSAQVRTVINAVKNHEVKSKDEVEKLYDTVKKELKIDSNDEFKDFKLDILENLVDMVEERVKAKEKQEVADRFASLTTGMSEDDAIAKLREDPAIDTIYNQHFVDNEGDVAATKRAFINEFKNDLEAFTTGMSRADAIKAMEDDPKFKKSYHSEFFKDIALANAREQVQKAIIDQIGKIQDGGKTITDGKDVEDAVIAELKAKGSYDKYAKKVLRGELTFAQKVNWDRSNIKALRKRVAAENRVNEIKTKEFSEKQIKDALKTDKVFYDLFSMSVALKDQNGIDIVDGDGNVKRAPLITQTLHEDGSLTYNVSNLSDLIRRRLGADLRANKQLSKLSPFSEIENVRKEISASIGHDITTKDAKKLIKLCGFDLESKNWAKVLYDALIGTAIDGASAAVGIFTTPSSGAAKYVGPLSAIANFTLTKDIPIKVNASNNNYLELNLNIGSGVTFNQRALTQSLLMSGLSPEDFTITQTENGIQLIIKHSDNYSETFIHTINENISKEFSLEELGFDPNQYEVDGNFDKFSALGKTMLVALALNLLRAALKEQGEYPQITTQFNTQNIEEYLAMLAKDKKMTPALFEGIKALAYSFVEMKDGVPVEGGKWDSESFKRVLNTNIAGDESVANPHEVYIYLNTLEKNKPERVSEPEPVVIKQVEVKEEESVSEPDKWALNEDAHINVRKTGWEELRKMYDDSFPKEKVEINGKKRDLSTRMLKVMQGMQETKLTVEQIRTLAEMSFSIPIKRKQSGELDAEDFEKKARAKFADVDFLKDYNFNYTQFALSICSAMPGDDKNELIAPEVLYHDDGTICERGYNPADMKFTGGGKVGYRGEVGNTYEGATQVNGQVNHNASRQQVDAVRNRQGTVQDQNLLNRRRP